MAHELTVNLHMHTCYSDGTGTHADIGAAAVEAGLDVVIVTDHNVLVQGAERYFEKNGHRTLLLVGEEVHDRQREPQKNHMLVIGADRDLAPLAANPQTLINGVDKASGVSFLAHPYDPELKAFGEPDISWVDWHVRGYTGIELWNGLSEFKAVLRGWPDAIVYALFPERIARGPHPSVLRRWDELTAQGQRVVAVGGSDAHALHMHLGPIRRTIFPYLFHFRAINTHLLADAPLTGDLTADRKTVVHALRSGHAFVGYDKQVPTRGFRFTGQAQDRNVSMGDEVQLGRGGITLQVRMPEKAECRLIRDGSLLRTWRGQQICAQIITEPGVYRVECWQERHGSLRGWIFSNPIYVRK